MGKSIFLIRRAALLTADDKYLNSQMNQGRTLPSVERTAAKIPCDAGSSISDSFEAVSVSAVLSVPSHRIEEPLLQKACMRRDAHIIRRVRKLQRHNNRTTF